MLLIHLSFLTILNYYTILDVVSFFYINWLYSNQLFSLINKNSC